MTKSDPSVALTLAAISSKTRVRLNNRGVQVDPPADHAARLVRFMAIVAKEPYCASPEHSERVLSEFNRMESVLEEAAR